MAKDKALVTQLQAIPLFSKMGAKCVAEIADEMKPYSFSPGEDVVIEDDTAQFGRLFVILEGTATATVGNRTVAEYGPGDHFGEMSVLDGSPRSATVTASSPLSTVALASWNLRALMKEHNEIAVGLIDVLVTRLRAADAALHD
jgi:CRP/FNR family transcriptional regulator, cyclic AMP receptor protein